LGGDLNWDYRYCWLRDAAFTVRGMLELGHSEEAHGFTQWLLHATRLTQPRLEVLYDVFGRRPPKERVLSNLAGHGGASPVRVGNGAVDQLQLDVYGEVIDAVWRIACAGTKLDSESCSVIIGFGRYVCSHWEEADEGIWEPRSGRELHTHSAVLCWAALDRLIDLQQRGDVPSKHRALFEEHRARIRRVVEQRGFNSELDSYTATFDGHTVDATLLLLAWYGFADATAARMRSTFRRIRRELSPRPGLLYRYDPRESNEGAFGICSFWVAEYLARGGGTRDEAQREFERTLAFANDVGLFGEEIDADTGCALGNFPQTFTHVGLINAALALEAIATDEHPRPPTDHNSVGRSLVYRDGQEARA
jgi:GH15 family glucan-1,4-alpha-glucosidase